MNFTSGDYPLFLIAVFLLYALARTGRGWGVLARAALMTIFADCAFAVITDDVRGLWDPVGGALLQLARPEGAPSTWAPIWHYVVGAGVLGGMLAAGDRYADAIATPRVQAWIARGAALALATIGTLVFTLDHADRLDEMTDLFRAYGHLLFLAGLGIAIGSSGGRPRAPLGRVVVLFLASCLFYHAWAMTKDGAYKYFLCVILGIVVLDYHLGLWIERTEDPLRRKLFLIASLCANLGVLAIFKYADFFRIDVLHAHVKPWHLILPAGISFHTFQSLSYTIDVYRRHLRATTSFVQFATFVMFFPQLVAGPIVRAEELLPQLDDPPPHDADRGADGMYRIVVGLFKKIAISDLAMVPIADNVFKYPDRFSSVEVLIGVLAYAFQIYLDFSAYSDIAIGSAQLLGFTLPENFRTPYRSANLQEFWRRWHMSLSRWLRDYLYIPLGGSRGGELLTYRNLILTMLLGGLWHGASWTYVVWGALHGGGLAVTRVFQRRASRHPESEWRTLGLFAAIAAAGVLLHRFAFGDVGSYWFHLAFAWAYLTPLWAALTAWLSLDEKGPAIKGPPRERAALGLRFGALWCIGALGVAIEWGTPTSALLAIAGALALACAADAVDASPTSAETWRWAIWAGKRAAAVVLVFAYVCVAWIFFRATSFENAHEVLSRIAHVFDAGEHDHANIGGGLVVALVAAFASHLVPNRTAAWARESFVKLPPPVQGVLIAGCALALRAFAHAQPKIVPFIYFQF